MMHSDLVSIRRLHRAQISILVANVNTSSKPILRSLPNGKATNLFHKFVWTLWT